MGRSTMSVFLKVISQMFWKFLRESVKSSLSGATPSALKLNMLLYIINNMKIKIVILRAGHFSQIPSEFIIIKL